jgi:NADPH:quinone reductase-like Zn-dependent oxidoreductase
LDEVRATWIEGLELVASGRVQLDVTRVMALEAAAEAHRLIEAGEVVGKVVLAIR